MKKLGLLASVAVIAAGTTVIGAADAAVTPGTYGSTDTTSKSNADTQSNSTATANTYPGAAAQNRAAAEGSQATSTTATPQSRKSYMTPTSNPMRNEACSPIQKAAQATLNGQPMNGGTSNTATNAASGPMAEGQGVVKGTGGSPDCLERKGTANPTPPSNAPQTR